MRACTPDRDGYVDCEGVKVFYEVFGEGNTPTLLLIHGWQVAPSTLWKAQVPYLARHYRVVTYDWPGNGRSDRPQDLAAYHPDRMHTALQAVMGATCPDAPILVGMSGGAVQALMQVLAAPESVRGIALLGMPWFRRQDLDRMLEHPFAPVIVGLMELLGRDDDDEAWRAFAEDFYRLLLPEPHSSKQFEDGVGWALDGYRPGLIANLLGDGNDPPGELVVAMLEALPRPFPCPVLVLHGDKDPVAPAEVARHFADLIGADLVIVEEAGHLLQARHPVLVNRLLTEFVDRVHPRPLRRTWRPPLARRPRKALYLPSPIGLGHTRRDLAIARALRARRPELEIDWLAQPPVTTVLADAGERVHEASNALVLEAAHWDSECGEHDLHAFQALRRMDEILVANFMVFQDLVERERYDLVIADEAWDVDHFLFENPELKRFSYAWLSDFVGFLPMPSGGDREAALTTDYNAEMLEHVDRYPRLRDRAIFVGDPEDIVPDAFGPGLPTIAEWTREHYAFPGFITGFELEKRERLRAELGYGADETVCIISVGGSAAGRHLLRTAVTGAALASRERPMRVVAVCGPRIDPARLDVPEGVDVRGYVPELHRHFQACDVAIVQGGLTTCMELTAARRPFLYFPLANHFEQQRHVPHRLNRYRAGRRMDFADSTPESIAEQLLDVLGGPVDYLPVATDGADRAAALIADLV